MLQQGPDKKGRPYSHEWGTCSYHIIMIYNVTYIHTYINKPEWIYDCVYT